MSMTLRGLITPLYFSPLTVGDQPVVCVTANGSPCLKGRLRVNHHSLYWWDEVPKVLQFNPYVKSGYRAGARVTSWGFKLVHVNQQVQQLNLQDSAANNAWGRCSITIMKQVRLMPG